VFFTRTTNSPNNIREMITLLRKSGELVEISAPVSSDQELAEIHRRVISAKGPALLFTKVDSGKFPVVTNMFGTTERVQRAFGSRPKDFVSDAVSAVMHAVPPKPSDVWKYKHLPMQALNFRLSRQHSGPITQVMEPPRLSEIPLLKLWPEDGGHFVTLPLVYTQSPEEGKPNLGMYRIQRYDDYRTGIHWQIGKGGGFHYMEAEALNKPLPVSLFVGGPPALILSAIAPLPEKVPEILLASLLLGKPLPVVRRKSWVHPVPAECEFAFLGFVPPHRRKLEGPFGDHYGYYSLKHPYPVFHCKQVWRRKDAIWPATVVGKPRQEDFFIGDYLQDLLSPIFPLVMPSVRDLWSYGETGFHALAAAVVQDRYPREAMASAFRILGEGQLSLQKFLILVNQPMDLRKFKAVWKHVLERVEWETDLYVFGNLSMDTLDYAGPKVNKGSKGVILGLGEAKRTLPTEFTGSVPPGVGEVHVYCPGCLCIGGPTFRENPDYPAQVAALPCWQGWQFILICDNPRQAAASDINFLWTAFTRFEPAADLHSAGKNLVRSHVSFKAPLILDARMKPWYPKEVFADRGVAAKVEQRWKEYFPAGKVEMGSSDLGDLTPSQ
jgi:UbiD family decarboxylase